MSESPTVGRSAYWAVYRELFKEVLAHWWKQTVYTQLLFLVGLAVHALYLKKRVEAFESLEFHLVYVVAPSLLLLAAAFLLSFLRAPFRVARTIEADRDRLRERVETQDEQPVVLHEEGLKFQRWLEDSGRSVEGLRLLLEAAADLLDSTLGEPEGERLFEFLGERRGSGELYQRLSYEHLARQARDYVLAMAKSTHATPVSSVPDVTAVLDAVERTLKDGVTDCVETMGRFGGKPADHEAEPRCVALDNLVMQAILGEKRELYRERAAGELDATGLTRRYEFLRSHCLGLLSTEDINPHCGVTSWREWLAKFKAGTIPPSNAKRIEVAKKLLKDARLEFRKEVVEANASRETALEYFKLIHKLVTVVAVEPPSMENYFKIEFGDSHWHRMNSEGGACCEIYAANLSNVGEQLKLPSPNAVPPFLRPEFMPKDNASWRDY